MIDKNRRWFTCPKCKGMGTVDEEQDAGTVSIVCPCGWHGYIGESQAITLKNAGRVEDVL